MNTTYNYESISLKHFFNGPINKPLSLANKLNASLNLLRISKNSSSLGPRARIANRPSPACAAPLPNHSEKAIGLVKFHLWLNDNLVVDDCGAVVP